MSIRKVLFSALRPGFARLGGNWLGDWVRPASARRSEPPAHSAKAGSGSSYSGAPARPRVKDVEEGGEGGCGGRYHRRMEPEADHGLFSYFLMKGLEGDADTNNDKKITNGELHNYVRSNVARQAVRLGREQTPQLQGDENRVLVEFN